MGLPMVGSVLSGGELLVVVGVGGICIVGLVSDLLVGGWLEGVVVWCESGVGRLRCRFRIWCVMVAVGLRLMGILVGFWAVSGVVAGW